MKRHSSYSWVYLLVGMGYLWVALNMLFVNEVATTVCIFKNVTGFACPSCGSTRALLSILNGQFSEAFYLNPLGYFGLTIMLMVPIMYFVGRIRKTNLVASVFSQMEVLVRQPRLAIPLIGLIAVNWVWNIYKGL